MRALARELEPQLAAEGEPCGEGLGGEQPAGRAPSSDRCGLVEEGPRVEDLEDLDVRRTDGRSVALG